MNDLSHLNREAVALTALGNSERIRAIYEDRWIDYSRATFLLEALNGVLARPRTTRMASVAIYADSGMGKTMLMQHFLTLHKASFNRAARCEQSPVLSLQMVSRPSERRFYTQILDVIGAPPNPRISLADLEIIALRMLRHIDLKMLLIDETHNILAAAYSEQRAMLNLLRFLSNELRVSVVCFGAADAKEAISGDAQLARRFQEYEIPRWEANEEFQALVVAILRNLPLRQPSILSTRALKRVLQISDGITARIFSILQEVAIQAIRSERECITDELIANIQPPSAQETRYA
jgi:hypothetical protein